MELLEAAIAKLGGAKQVAKYLGVSQPFVSQMRSGVRTLPAIQAARLAELLERNPAQAFIEAEISAAGKDEAANLRRWFKSVAAGLAAVCVTAGMCFHLDESAIGSAYQNGHNDSLIHYIIGHHTYFINKTLYAVT